MENSITHHKLPANVSPVERGISFYAGAHLLVDALLHKRRFRTAEALAGGFLVFRALYGYCPIYAKLGKKTIPDSVRNINIHFSERINRPRWELYNIWRQLENLPQFLDHISSVKVINDLESEWTARGIGGLGKLSWKATIVKDEPGRLLGWTSRSGSAVETSGKISFEDAGDAATDLQVVISYRPPLGALGATAGKLFSKSFEKLVRQDIAGLKDALEKTKYQTESV